MEKWQEKALSPQRYGLVAIVFHWLLAVAILSAFGFGLFLVNLPLSPLKIQLINLHKWAGITILLASLLRLLWRFAHRPPPLPDAIQKKMPAWQKRVHHMTHGLMYLLFFLVPLAGWAYSSAKGYPVVFLGIVPLPDLVGKNDELAQFFKEVHKLGAFSLIGLVVLHVLGVVKHHFIDRDRLLGRMLPWA